MPGNTNHSAASVHPFHRSGAIIENPRPQRTKANEQQGQSDDVAQVPAPPGQARQVLAAELAESLWRRQVPGLDQQPSSTGGLSSVQNFGAWRDQLLAEIEVLAETLKKKVARYSLLRAAQSSEEAVEPADETAVVWIQDALEDLASTALGIEIASRELLLRAASVEEQDSKSETAREQTAGTAE